MAHKRVPRGPDPGTARKRSAQIAKDAGKPAPKQRSRDIVLKPDGSSRSATTTETNAPRKRKTKKSSY